MAKKKLVLGSVMKHKTPGKPDYVKLDKYNADKLAKMLATCPPEGLILNLESREAQLKSLDEAVAAGRLKAESAAKMRPFVEKIPSFVRFQVTTLVEEQ